MKRLLKLLFFCASLHTYYFYQVGLPLISLISVCLLAVTLIIVSARTGLKIPLNAASGIALAYLLVLIWSLLGLLLYGEAPMPKRIMAFLVCGLSALVGSNLLRKVPMEELVRFLLVGHAFFFFVQFLAFYVGNYAVDFLAPFTGEEQRMFGGDFTFPIINRFMRTAGLYNEPGAYVTFVAPFLALFGRWEKQSKANRRIFWASLGSVFLSFSFYGAVFGSLIAFFSASIRLKHRIMALLLSAPFVLPVLYNRFVLRPAVGQGTGFEIRQVYAEESWRFLMSSPISFLFGSNLLVIDPRADLGMASNDIGLGGYFLHFAGVPLTFLFVGIFLYFLLRLDGPGRLALVIVFFSKHSMFEPFFPILLATILWPYRSYAAAASQAATGPWAPRAGLPTI